MSRGARTVIFLVCAVASVMFLISANRPAEAATVNQAPQARGSVKVESEEPAHRVLLLGATIYGMVAVPKAIYDVPWQEPFQLDRGVGELERNFLKEIFRPIDREEFLKSHRSP